MFALSEPEVPGLCAVGRPPPLHPGLDLGFETAESLGSKGTGQIHFTKFKNTGAW